MEVDCSYLNKELSLEFTEGYRVWQKAPEEGQRIECQYSSLHQEGNIDKITFQILENQNIWSFRNNNPKIYFWKKKKK